MFQLLDSYAASGMPLLWVASWECIAISYGYGIRRYYNDVSTMLTFTPGWFWPFSWAILTPLVTVVSIQFIINTCIVFLFKPESRNGR